MSFLPNTYQAGSSPVHACDARAKLVLLLAYSVTLFLVETWLGLGLCAVAFLAALAASRVPVRGMLKLALPVYILAAFAVAFNSFAFDVRNVPDPSGFGAVSAGVLSGMEPVALAGSFGFVPAGFARGCFYALRIVLLVFASLVVCYTTTSNGVTEAMASFMRPLRKVRVPVDDIASVVSIALRFLPLCAEEILRVRNAQWARGADFEEGGLWRRVSAWLPVFVPVLVSLFRRADRLASAMDARCYGAGPARTTLHDSRLKGSSIAALCVGLAACAALGVCL